jgi:transposase
MGPARVYNVTHTKGLPRSTSPRHHHGQRWQVESGFSRSKRLLGSALRARKWVNQKKEILLRALTHNLMLLAAA